jgi:L-lactate dehydrogenase
MTSDIGHGKVTLTDVADELVKGQVMDLEDLGGAHGGVSAASLKEAGQADVIIVSAGRGVREGETRLDCLKANHGIMKSIVDGMQPIKKSSIILVLANPCDILAYYVWGFSGLPSSQVIGSGCLLDTIRLRNMMSQSIGAHVDSIQCDVLGEHGDTQFAAASLATIGGIPLSKYCDIDVDALLAESSKKGAAIRVRKGATAFGVATSTKTIIESIFKDQRKILPVSVKVPGEEMYLSMPTIIGYQGVEKVIDVRPHLTAKEQEKWKISLDAMKAMLI